MTSQSLTCLSLCAALAGCTTDVDLSSKRCPCGGGWVCDGLTNRCVEASASGDICELIELDFRGLWATPNNIQWGWNAFPDEARFAAYELVVAESETDLQQRSGTAATWTAEQNAELGAYTHPLATGVDPVVATITSGHSHLTFHYGQLVVRDTAAKLWCSNVGTIRTADEARSSFSIFRDDLPSGAYTVQPDYEVSTTNCYEDSPGCMHWVASCPGGETSCFDNLAIESMPYEGSELAGINPGAFEHAYLEFAVATDSPLLPYWCSTFLRFGTGDRSAFSFNPYSLEPDGVYRLVQVPLRQLLQHIGEDDGPPLEQTKLSEGLRGFAVGVELAPGSNLWMDEASLKW